MTQRVLRLVEQGKTILTTDARFGSLENPTIKGTFRVYRKDANHISSQYLTPMPYAMFFNGGEAVHYSKYFHADGYFGASHGCVNIRDMAVAKYLFHVTALGTPVVVYAS
jgi:lipoprotein-anchoring transpeptidase ErfK/SrfK